MILLDYFLPQTNGLEVLKKIKLESPKTEVIIISGQEQLQVVIDVFKNGAYDYVIKNNEITDRVIKSIVNYFAKKKVEAEIVVLKIKLNKYKLYLTTSLLIMSVVIVVAYYLLR